MGCQRDKQEDRARTRDVLMGNRSPDNGLENWLGHGVNTGAASIDNMLLRGATRQQMEEEARGGVTEHLYDLRRNHGLPLWQDEDGKLKFDHVVLAIDRKQLSLPA